MTGWSPFGIFVFVVFIITLISCIIGCGYNFKVKGRTGVEIIPGIDIMRRGRDRCYDTFGVYRLKYSQFGNDGKGPAPHAPQGPQAPYQPHGDVETAPSTYGTL
eukprot:GFYU01020969.1.p2 GENE.GFYU01020969.1~~GFYU01020969.1.p2  ORF type:complete len:104 (+),score=27.15 GFYU01020969.1:385-696(+)